MRQVERQLSGASERVQRARCKDLEIVRYADAEGKPHRGLQA